MRQTMQLLFLFVSFISFSQKLKCSDFKTGHFTMTSDQFPDTSVNIYRDEKIQVETLIASKTINSEAVEETTYEIIEWLGECKYKLTFDNSKGKESELTNYINANGGVITTIIKIEGNCYLFESTLKINGKKEKISGQICKTLDY